MPNVHHTTISRIGNSQGVRIPKALLHQLGTTEVILEPTEEGILIKPALKEINIPPIEQWDALMRACEAEDNKEWEDWDNMPSPELEDQR